jgi:hypothetical protein
VSSFFSSAASSSTLGAETFFLGLAVEAFLAGVESPLGVLGAFSFVTLGVFLGYHVLVMTWGFASHCRWQTHDRAYLGPFAVAVGFLFALLR